MSNKYIPQAICACTISDIPCTPMCTCKNGYMSGGCLNCASYESLEQQKAMAENIQARLKDWVEKIKLPVDTNKILFSDFVDEEYDFISWELIMKARDKFVSLASTFVPKRNDIKWLKVRYDDYEGYQENIISTIGSGTIEDSFEVLIEAIKWYNLNNSYITR